MRARIDGLNVLDEASRIEGMGLTVYFDLAKHLKGSVH